MEERKRIQGNRNYWNKTLSLFTVLCPLLNSDADTAVYRIDPIHAKVADTVNIA